MTLIVQRPDRTPGSHEALECFPGSHRTGDERVLIGVTLPVTHGNSEAIDRGAEPHGSQGKVE